MSYLMGGVWFIDVGVECLLLETCVRGCLFIYFKKQNRSTVSKNLTEEKPDGKIRVCESCILKDEKLCEAQSCIEFNKLRIREVKQANTELKFENQRMKERSDDITRQMANKLEIRGELENTGDEFSNTKLAQRFEQDIYEKKWVSLLEFLIEEYEEEEAITELSKMLKICYQLVVKESEDQIRRFLCLGNNDDIPAIHEIPNGYNVRRKNGTNQQQRDRMVKTVVTELMTSHNWKLCNAQSNQDKLEEFFKEFTDCCWLMAISNPPLNLEFDVVGMDYRSTLTQRFQKYSTQESVVDETRQKGTIIQVVWPSLSAENGKSMYKKGSVLTVDECKLEKCIVGTAVNEGEAQTIATSVEEIETDEQIDEKTDTDGS